MTETQAKSGAAGASTDAEETSVETSASPDDGGTKANPVSITDAVESPTTVVRLAPSSDTDDEASSSKSGEDAKPSGFSWPAASSASTAPPTSPGSSTGGSARSSYTPTPTPTST